MPRVKLFDQEEALKKAMELFWTKGYSATSMQDLVDHMGINRASLYDTFGGKDALFKSAFEYYRKSNSQAVADFLDSQPQVKEGFYKLFVMGIDASVADKNRRGCFVVNTTTELIPGHPEIQKIIRDNKTRFEKVFLDYLKKGEDEGQFQKGKDLKAIASLLFTLYNGIKVTAKVEPNRNKLIKTIKAALTVLD